LKKLQQFKKSFYFYLLPKTSSLKQKNNHIRHISFFKLDCVEKFIKVFFLAKTLSRKDEELCAKLFQEQEQVQEQVQVQLQKSTANHKL
jgi:hypothetical protein